MPLRDGKLTAKSFIGGLSARASDHQDDFFAAVQHLGFERGVKGSRAHHARVKRHYGRLETAAERARSELERSGHFPLTGQVESLKQTVEVTIAALEYATELTSQQANRDRDMIDFGAVTERYPEAEPADGTRKPRGRFAGKIVDVVGRWTVQLELNVRRVIHDLYSIPAALRKIVRVGSNLTIEYDIQGRVINVAEMSDLAVKVAATVPDLVKPKRDRKAELSMDL